MPQLIIPLSQLSGPGVRRYRILQAFNACCFLAVAFLRPRLDWTAIAIGTYGIILLLVIAFWPFFYREYQLILDDHGIRGHIAWRKHIDFSWDKIAKADLGILHLEILTTDGTSCSINLGNLTYRQHRELKPRLQEFLVQRGLVRESKVRPSVP